MGRFVSRESTPEKYSESHIRGILNEIGVRIVAETSHDFLCFCPIHNNRHTPSLSVSKTKDGYLCFNADCAASGTIVDLVSQATGRNYFEAARFVLLNKPSEQDNFEDELNNLLSDKPDFREFSPEVLEKLQAGMAVEGNAGREYMHGRGFSDDTIDYFKLGYSSKKNMVAVPVHSPDGIPIGVVGRTASKTTKVFKNSVGLPTSKTFFNIHRAKRVSSTVIVTEASFDTLAVHQAGYPNVVGNLGGHMSPEKLYLLDRHFDRIILFLDNPVIDDSGKKLGEKIAKVFSKRKEVLWAKTDNWLSGWYPDDLKDASAILEEFGEQHIRQTIEGAIPIWEYESTMVQYNNRAANVPNTN